MSQLLSYLIMHQWQERVSRKDVSDVEHLAPASRHIQYINKCLLGNQQIKSWKRCSMLSSKVSTPIFAKSSSTRRIGEYQAGSSKTKSTAPAHKTLEEANLRIVQYEIAEREACKVLSSMCQEASQRLGIVDTEYEIDDKLSGILVLGNLYKRVGNEKSSLESTIEKMKEEYTTLETEKNFMVGIVNIFLAD